MSYWSVSTWSLHRLLGPLRWTVWDDAARTHVTRVQDQPQVHTLLELPSEAARRGYQALEVCHFHFPSTETAYLKELKQSFAAAGIRLDTLLLDYGNLTDADPARREADLSLIRSWIKIASECGARQLRVIAGEAAPSDEEAIRLSAAALSELSVYAAPLGVQVITENFKSLTSTGASCLKLLEEAGRPLPLITDFGNFAGPAKYEELAMTVPHSVSVHVKPIYDEHGIADEAELRLCLEAVDQCGYDGAFVLIYDGPGDMWEGLERVRRLAERLSSRLQHSKVLTISLRMIQYCDVPNTRNVNELT
ncbi:sugar phosphate isomerase/epimerase family protein [Paenibacillus puerhi]|uniref:sugar phosphate isomerase/epimerase family protein n=1 Tax=Paenibacillus puerhi TaxID=2692622 RepID=UPI0013595198|nr:sugar phosphate isomerase/epimerase family protein [Paenibacillus puerhi]